MTSYKWIITYKWSVVACSHAVSCRCIPRPHTLNSPKDAPERSEPLLPQRIRHQGLVAATREVAPQSTM
jgi:hypothetical protein